jgi:hypothetical protein
MSGTQACTCTLQTADLYSLLANEVILDVPTISNFHPPLRFFMTITADNSDAIEYGFQGDNMFFARVRVGGSTMFEDTSVYEPGPRYWKIREQDGQISFESSDDGAMWELELQTAAPFDLGAIYFGFGAQVEDTMPGSIGISVPNFNPAL